MANYYVDGASGNDSNAGTTGSPWKTLRKPLNTAAVVSGDVIKVRTATYYESLNITKGIRYEADTGHTPTIDGRYSPALFGATGYTDKNGKQIGPNQLPYPSAANGSRGNWVITSSQTAIVQLTAANSGIKGFIVRNVCGRGIGATGNNARAEDCIIDFTYGGSSYIEGGDNIIFDNITMTRGSVKYFDPTRDGSGPGKVQTSCIVKVSTNAIVENSTIAFCYGEGIVLDKGSSGATARYNTCHTNAHFSLGINEADSPSIYGNVVYWCNNLVAAMDKSGPGPLVTIGNEQAVVTENGVTYEYPAKAIMNNLRLYNNLFIGGGDGLTIASGSSGRPVAFIKGYIGYNTMVGAADTAKVMLWGCWSKQAHKDTLVENNIFIKHPQGATLVKYEGGGSVTWRNNLGNASLSMGGTNNVITPLNETALADPFVAISGSYNVKSTALPDVTTTFNPANYDLPSSSPAIGRASNRGDITGLKNPEIAIDRYKAGRTDYSATRYYDIGADEYDAGAPPPEDDTLTASFNRTPASGSAPLTVNYTDTSQVTGAAAITDWLWEFGDGTTSTSQNPTKTYSAAGTYTTKLTVTDSVNALTSTFTGGSVTVTAVETGSVSARFTRTPAAGEAGVTSFTFTDTSTVTGDAVIDTWEWDFRDGTTSALQNPTKTYSAAGTYRPRLTVRDSVRGYASTWTGPDTVVSPTAPDPLIEASFTQSATAGQAPLAVTFTDTSQEVGGAAITSWSWDFGDGNTSATQSPTHTYQAAGTYRATLTIVDSVNGLTDVATGALITVTAAPPPGTGDDVTLRQTRAALNTSDGSQTFTASGLGGLTPVSARFIVTGATADGTAADGELFGYGATAGGAQWAAAIAAQHGVADTNAARMFTDAACLLLVDGSGNELMRATFVGWTADGVTVNIDWTGTPAAYLVTVVFGAGTEYRAWVGTAALGANNSTTNVSVGFAADLVRGVATWGTREAASVDATLSLGFAHRLGGQYVVERRYPDALADAAQRLRLFEGEFMHCRYNTAARAGVFVSGWSSDGVTLRVKDDAVNSTGLIMAEKFGDVGSRVALVDSAITTGSKSYALDWDPQYVEHLLSQAEALTSYNDNAKAGTIGVHTKTENSEYSNLASGENGAVTTNEQSLSDNQFIVVGHTGATVAAGATTFGTAEYAINYATAPGTALKLPSLAVEVGAAVVVPGDWVTAEFTADVVTGAAPLRVQFTDLSAGSNPVAGWEWDFGDGTSSTEQHPAHTYAQGGEFTVSLTASDGLTVPTTDTETKSGYITVAQAAKREIIIGPYQMRPITEATTATTYRDPADEANGGYMEVGLALNGLRLNADPEVPAALSGEWVLYIDAASGDLKVKRSDSTTGTVDVT